MDEFAGKVALITGAGRGIGREIALAMASLGIAIAANDINPINLDETVNQVVQAGGKASAYVFDIAKRMPIEGMITQVLSDFGRIDILVNHASVHPDASLLEMDEWEFHRTIDVNLGGPFFCMQQVGRIMQEQGGGSIVNLIASEYKNFHKGHTAHSSSQAALVGLTQAAAIELAVDHIRVNAVYYGSNRIEMVSSTDITPTILQTWQEIHPQLLISGHPDLITKVIYLCSHESEFLNGRVIAATID
ncbi:MAG TPA: SDR family oxidoreductase [Anaerolineales bacterium]|nr:SDR family oxidoreductase [Anaerolineales bacterium]